jgi:maltokinase
MAEWLTTRRWFAGKGREISGVSVSSTPWLHRDPPVRLELVEVSYADGDSEIYQVPVEYREAAEESLGHALIGQCTVADLGEPHRWAYEAVHDKTVTNLWLDGMASGRLETGISFQREPSAPSLPVGATSLVLGGEQSNTSVVFGDAVILKLFRRLTEGLNPDVELHHALAEVGNPHVAALYGWVEGTWTTSAGAEQSGTLAIAQEFLKSSTEGWDLAIASVRGLFREDAAVSAAESGADFAGESYRLGQATAAVHRDLAKVLGRTEVSGAELAAIAQGMLDRLAEARLAAPALEPYAEGLAKIFTDLAEHSRPLRVQRVHGDLHLGQVMRVPTGWRLIDFEGEPARPLPERRLPHSPLKDVAGMLRSFDYAARHLLADETDPAREYRAAEWATRNQQAFCDGYAEASDVDLAAEAAVLHAFTLDKAVYEVVYETRNRPTWLPVPLAAIAALVG